MANINIVFDILHNSRIRLFGEDLNKLLIAGPDTELEDWPTVLMKYTIGPNMGKKLDYEILDDRKFMISYEDIAEERGDLRSRITLRGEIGIEIAHVTMALPDREDYSLIPFELYAKHDDLQQQHLRSIS